MSTLTRRDFNARMVVLGAGSALFSATPFFSSTVLAEVTKQWGVVPPIDMGFDGALENQPGYSALIPVSPQHRHVDTTSALNDPQLC